MYMIFIWIFPIIYDIYTSILYYTWLIELLYQCMVLYLTYIDSTHGIYECDYILIYIYVYIFISTLLWIPLYLWLALVATRNPVFFWGNIFLHNNIYYNLCLTLINLILLFFWLISSQSQYCAYHFHVLHCIFLG